VPKGSIRNIRPLYAFSAPTTGASASTDNAYGQAQGSFSEIAEAMQERGSLDHVGTAPDRPATGASAPGEVEMQAHRLEAICQGSEPLTNADKANLRIASEMLRNLAAPHTAPSASDKG
jgi:hypothetical protein